MFHLREGWFFVRLPDGSVEIIKRENGSPDTPVVTRIVASPEDWASVIASVSLMGDHAENFRKAVELHSGLTTNAPDVAYASACKVCGKPVDAHGHYDMAIIDGTPTITAAYCAEHWQKLGEHNPPRR